MTAIPPAGHNRKEWLALQQDSFRLDTRQNFLEMGGLQRTSGGPRTERGQGRQARAHVSGAQPFTGEGPKDLSKPNQPGEFQRAS